MRVIPGKIYRHYKGGYYVAIGEASHTETSERMVVYHPLQSPDILYVRPAWEFFEKIPPHPHGNQSQRFIPVGPQEVLRDAK